MKQLYIKQKVFSLSGKFTVKDQQERDVYYVEGSFLRVPKTFSIMNTARDEVALITKKVFSLLPKFFVEVNGREVLTIQKEFSFFKARYNINWFWYYFHNFHSNTNICSYSFYQNTCSSVKIFLNKKTPISQSFLSNYRLHIFNYYLCAFIT